MRRAAAAAVSTARSVAEVAIDHQLSWPTLQRAVGAFAELVLGEPAPTPLLGIDETRFGGARWIRGGDGNWVRIEPWETGFVDLYCAHSEGGQGCWARSTDVPPLVCCAGRARPGVSRPG